MGWFYEIEEVIAVHEESGGFFFSPETMRFFGSEIDPVVRFGHFFVTSEQDSMGTAWGGERRWTVRRCDDDGSIDTVVEFGEFRSLDEAVRELAECWEMWNDAYEKSGV